MVQVPRKPPTNPGNDYDVYVYDLQAEKRELAMQARAILLLAKIKMMQFELFHPTTDELKEVA